MRETREMRDASARKKPSAYLVRLVYFVSPVCYGHTVGLVECVNAGMRECVKKKSIQR